MGESAESLFNRGLDNHDRGAFQGAIDCYKQAIALDPNMVVAHNNLGMVYIDNDQMEDALAELKLTLQLDPAYAEAYNNLGFVYRRLGEDVNAATCYARFLELEPDVEEAPKIRSWAEQVAAANGGLYDIGAIIGLNQPAPEPELGPEPKPQMGPPFQPTADPQPEIDESIFGARTMVMGQGLSPMAQPAESAETLCERGVGEFERGDLEAAEATLRRAVEIDPQLAIAGSTLGRVLAKAGRFEEAVEVLRQAVGLDPNDAAAFYVLGFSLRNLGWDEDAAAAYEQYLELTPDAAEAAQIRSWIAEVHQNLAPQQMSPDELYSHAVEHYNGEDLDEAMEALEHALSLDETHAASALLLGRILVDKGDLIRAVPILKRAERLQGDNPEIHYYIGAAYEKRGMPEEAQASYAKCLELNPPAEIAEYAKRFLEKQRGSKSRQLNSATRCEYCFRPFPAEQLASHQGKKICRDCQGNLGLGPAAKPAPAAAPEVAIAASKPSESQARRMKPRRGRKRAVVVLLGLPLVLVMAFLGVLKHGAMSDRFLEWGVNDALANAGLREPLERLNIKIVTKADIEAERLAEQRRLEALKVPEPEVFEPLAAAAKQSVSRVMPGKSVSVEVTASGGKGAYAFSLIQAPAGMEVDGATGLITWKAPVTAAATEQRVRVKVACEEEAVAVDLTVQVGFGYRLGRQIETGIPSGDRVFMAVGNLNASGGRSLDDIVVVWGNYRRGQMGIFYQQAAAETFSSMARTELDGAPGALLVADLSGDGRNEMVVADWFSSKLVLFKQTAQGLLAKEQEVPSGRGVDCLAAGTRELFASHWAEPAIYRYAWDEGQSSKLVARPAVYPTNNRSGWNRLFVGPYGGGRPGVLLVCGSGGTPMKYFTARADGRLDFYVVPEPEGVLPEHPMDVVRLRLGEGPPIIAALFGGESPSIRLLRSGPEGYRLTATGIDLDDDPLAIAAADLNGDGLEDIVAVHPNHLAVFLAADAQGSSFGRTARIEIPGLMGPIAFGSFARDGQRDMLVLKEGGALQVVRASHFAEGGR